MGARREQRQRSREGIGAAWGPRGGGGGANEYAVQTQQLIECTCSINIRCLTVIGVWQYISYMYTGRAHYFLGHSLRFRNVLLLLLC